MSIKIWDIVSGPISKEDSDDPDDYPNNCDCMLVCKVELNGKIVDVDYWFEHLEDADAWIQHFKTSIEPLEIFSEGNGKA